MLALLLAIALDAAAAPSPAPAPATPAAAAAPAGARPAHTDVDGAALSLAGAFDDTFTRADFVIAVTGDYIPARSFNYDVVAHGDFDAPLTAVKPILDDADVAFVSLEAPLIPKCKPTRSGMFFCGDTRHAAALRKAGADVIALENNHTDNHGPLGRASTRRVLAEAGLQVASATAPALVDVRGRKVAFLSFNAVSVGYAPKRRWREAVQRARTQADVVVVQVHWGREYVATPQRTEGMGAPDEPRRLARLLVDAGADLVVGNHPHVIQGLELMTPSPSPGGKPADAPQRRRRVPVMYAHGNLLFDQLWRWRDTRESVVALYAFKDGAGVVDVKLVPLSQQGTRATRLEGADAARVLDLVQRRSRALLPRR